MNPAAAVKLLMAEEIRSRSAFSLFIFLGEIDETFFLGAERASFDFVDGVTGKENIIHFFNYPRRFRHLCKSLLPVIAALISSCLNSSTASKKKTK
jgi:hypothetical protein